jgi:uncharacterized protein
MKPWPALAVLLAVLLAAGGCGSSPKTRFYTLMPVPSANQAAEMARSGPPLTVGHVELPGTLDRAALVTQGPGPAITVSSDERWAAPLDELVRRALTGDLRARLGPTAVLAPGDPEPPGGVRRLALTVQRFNADSDGELVLEADWTLATGHPPKAGAIHHVHIAENAGSTEGDRVARAMSRALGVLADDISRAAR